MGGSSFSFSDWGSTSTSMKDKSTDQIYNARSLDDSINPSKMKGGMRESCDSDANPNSTAIIIGLDFTGSMHTIPDYMIKEGLGGLFKEIYDRKPVSDPQVLFCGIGDYDARDYAPFQPGQFESQCDLLINGLTKFWLRGCFGGGNGYESYDIPYYFAANHTKIDCMDKRGKKGFIFTIGDEPPPEKLSRNAVYDLFGDKVEADIPFDKIIDDVCKSYIPFHIVIEEGSHVRNSGLDSVLSPWRNLLGEHAIVCSDYTKISEIITSILEVQNGRQKSDIINSWDGSTAIAVDKAISGLTTKTESTSIVF